MFLLTPCKPDQTILKPIGYYIIHYIIIFIITCRNEFVYRLILLLGKRKAEYYGYIYYNIIIQVTWKYSIQTRWARTAANYLELKCFDVSLRYQYLRMYLNDGI